MRRRNELQRMVTRGRPAPEVYDYVIVGAGSAGCTLAARLTENGKYSVLQRSPPLGARSARRRQAAERRAICLEGEHRPAGRAPRQQALLAERANHRRLELGQWSRVRPWPSGEIRRMAGDRLPRLGLRRGASVFQEARGLRLRRPEGAWTRWPYRRDGGRRWSDLRRLR